MAEDKRRTERHDLNVYRCMPRQMRAVQTTGSNIVKYFCLNIFCNYEVILPVKKAAEIPSRSKEYIVV